MELFGADVRDVGKLELDKFRRRITAFPAGGVVGVQNAEAGGIHHENRVGGTVHQFAKEVQFGFGPVAGGLDAQGGDAKGQVVGQFGQQGHFLRGEGTGFGRPDDEGTEGFAFRFQGQTAAGFAAESVRRVGVDDRGGGVEDVFEEELLVDF